MERKIIKWVKLNEDATIPTKKDNDMGFDIYPIYDKNKPLVLKPFELFKLNTGLAYILPDNWHFLTKERTSSGGLFGIKVIGVADNSYTGELNLFLQNNNNKYLVISWQNIDEISRIQDFSLTDGLLEDIKKVGAIFYQKNKAICQVIPVYSENFNSVEGTLEDLKEKEKLSHRKDGKEGSSGK